MFERAALVGTIVNTLVWTVLAIGAWSSGALTMPPGSLSAGWWTVAGVLTCYLACAVFLLWKFKLQPALHGFRFNSSQDPRRTAALLAGCPKFYDTTQAEFSWVKDVESRAHEIVEEVRSLIATRATDEDPFHTAYHNKILALSPSWRTVNIVSYGVRNSPLLPKTVEVLSRVPHFFTCNLSRMAPRSKVKAHAGESNCYVRCHLGIKIPAQAPVTALSVGGEERSWREGRVEAFCDAHWHGAVNDSDDERYVLIFDVMPEKLGWYVDQFCALMVAISVTQYLLPGRLNLDEPLWKPTVLLGYVLFSTIGVPILTALYVYFRHFCRTRPRWMRALAEAGFGFYF